MEFGIEKCAELIMKSGKRATTEGKEQRNKKRIRTFGEKENCKSLEILEVNTVRSERKKKVRKERELQNYL